MCYITSHHLATALAPVDVDDDVRLMSYTSWVRVSQEEQEAWGHVLLLKMRLNLFQDVGLP